MAEKKRGAACLIRYGHEMFLILRSDIPNISNPMTWAVLAGGIEEGEDAETAMDRELREEIGTQVEREFLAETPSNTWWTASLSGQQVSNISRGEGTAHGFFSFEGLQALAKIDGKAGLGGAIKKFMERAPEEIKRFLESGKTPDPAKLFPQPAMA